MATRIHLGAEAAARDLKTDDIAVGVDASDRSRTPHQVWTCSMLTVNVPLDRAMVLRLRLRDLVPQRRRSLGANSPRHAIRADLAVAAAP
jgi:hypothetical protein